MSNKYIYSIKDPFTPSVIVLKPFIPTQQHFTDFSLYQSSPRPQDGPENSEISNFYNVKSVENYEK